MTAQAAAIAMDGLAQREPCTVRAEFTSIVIVPAVLDHITGQTIASRIACVYLGFFANGGAGQAQVSKPCHGQAGSKSSRSRQWHGRFTASPRPRDCRRTTPCSCRILVIWAIVGIVSAGRPTPLGGRFPVRLTGQIANPTAKMRRQVGQRHLDVTGLKLTDVFQGRRPRPMLSTVQQLGHSRSKAVPWRRRKAGEGERAVLS